MIIGITGGIGSGKSRVADFWSTYYKHPLVSLDAICKNLLDKGNPGWLALKKQFDSRFFDSSGRLDREGFRKAIFTDKVLRKTVDEILHPLAKQGMKEQCCSVSETVYLVEIPLLYEAGWQQEVGRIVVVNAAQATRVARIVRRDQVSEQEALLAIRAQGSLSEKALLADHVIENNDDWQNTRLQVIDLGRAYVPLWGTVSVR